MKLPTVDLTTSNYRIAAQRDLDEAKRRIDLAYEAEARGKHDTAIALMGDALSCYDTAIKQLQAHRDYAARTLATFGVTPQ